MAVVKLATNPGNSVGMYVKFDQLLDKQFVTDAVKYFLKIEEDCLDLRAPSRFRCHSWMADRIASIVDLPGKKPH